jgi:nicotinamidase-related amidase
MFIERFLGSPRRRQASAFSRNIARLAVFLQAEARWAALQRMHGLPTINGRTRPQGETKMKRSIIAAALAAFTMSILPAQAGNIVEDWAGVKAPAAPTLKPVTVDAKTTALLVMDLAKQTCNNEKRPRCVASIPEIAKLMAEARAKGVLLISTSVPPVPMTDILPQVAPKPGEPTVVAWVDKFVLGDKPTGLEAMLKEKGIKTVITVGTASYGAVLYTSSAAALRGYNVIVPVDGLSSEDQYFDQATVWLLTKGVGGIGPKVTLTTIDKIKF